MWTLRHATLTLMKAFGILLLVVAALVVIILSFYYRPTIEYIRIGPWRLL
jgi:hypothetical protein